MNLLLQHIQLDTQFYSPQTSINTELKHQPLVLIAENDSENRRNLKELLNLYNIRVIEAENGEEAIELTLQERPHLILINTKLPKFDGFETVQVIRNIKSLDDVPIIVLCSETDNLFRKRAFAVGGNSFHIAPLDLERLNYILEQFLFRLK